MKRVIHKSILAFMASALISVPLLAQGHGNGHSTSHSGKQAHAQQNHGPQPQAQNTQAQQSHQQQSQQSGAAAAPQGQAVSPNQTEQNYAAPNQQNAQNGNVARSAPQAGQQVRPVVGEWLRRYKDLSPDQQTRQLQNDPQFRRLPPARQQQLMQRLQNFNTLSTEQKNTLVDRMNKYESLSPEQQQHLRQLNDNLQQLPAQRQFAVRDALRRLNTMGPEERERILNSPRFQTMYSPNEVGIIRGLSGISVPPNQLRPPQTPPAGGPPFEQQPPF